MMKQMSKTERKQRVKRVNNVVRKLGNFFLFITILFSFSNIVFAIKREWGWYLASLVGVMIIIGKTETIGKNWSRIMLYEEVELEAN